MSGRIWLITGCSTGIGRAIAEHVVALGDTVVVTARKPADIADIVDGNGAVVRSGDAGELRSALDRLAADDDARSRARTRSLELAARFTPEAWAEGIERAVLSVREPARRPR